MQSSGSTRSSSDGSKRRPCCPPQRPPPCCSGPCLLQVRSTCARSMDGRRSQRSSAASRLTLPPDSILSSAGDRAAQNSNHIPGGTPGEHLAVLRDFACWDNDGVGKRETFKTVFFSRN